MSRTFAQVPQLSFGTTVDWSRGVLRAEDIRLNDFTDLVRDWGEVDELGESKRDAVIRALDEMAEAVASPRGEGEVDGRLADVEEVGQLEYASVELRLGDMLRLREELDAAIVRVARLNPVKDRGGDPRVSSLLAERRDGRDAA